MPLGTGVGLGQSDIVLDGELGTQFPHGKGHSSPPLFGLFCCGQTVNGRPSHQLLSTCCLLAG